MKRVVIICKDGSGINVEGDYMRFDEQGDFLLAWNGDCLVAVARVENIATAHISGGGK